MCVRARVCVCEFARVSARALFINGDGECRVKA